MFKQSRISVYLLAWPEMLLVSPTRSLEHCHAITGHSDQGAATILPVS